MTEVGKPRLLVIEDETSVRQALVSALGGHGYVVTARPDGTDLSQVMEDCRPDLCVLDIGLPNGPDGFELSQLIRSRGAPVIFVTAADGIADRLRGFDAGADDYVVKPFSIAELLVRIRAVLRRAGRAASATIEVRDLVIDLADRRATRAGTELVLTRTEFDLLAALAGVPGKSWTKRMLLDEIWGFDDYQPHLVEVHVSALRRKLERVGPRLIHTERGGAYVLRP